MTKSTLIVLLTFMIFGCTDINQAENTIAKLESLRAENDSLRKIVADIETKYVFDSISVRDIPDYKNTYELNSKIKGEIVFVGYNMNLEKSRVIMVDSVTYNPEKLHNPDTLKLQNGGYKYEIKLNDKEITWKADIKVENEYGQKMQGLLMNKAKAKKN
ncbi:hypothetical protein [Nonlabens sp. SY33080]|uniref:hypothetical protein n=1 Tax=Nonlabens sp. SY33080 TaxID=2719911 RepID=UPI001F0CEDCA|nr:hypothetical protein [Nonlabens sp. SY33080]